MFAIPYQIQQEKGHEESLVLQNIPNNSLVPLTDTEKKEVRMMFGNMCGKIEHFDELGLFKKYRGFDSRYVSHYMYLPIIAHKLNNYHYSKIFEHKSLLGYLSICSLKFPYCYVRCVDGEYYDNNMRQIDKVNALKTCLNADAIVIKDSVDTAGGKSVELLRLHSLPESKKNMELNRIFSERQRDYVIQECIKQHPSLAKFNPTSINTLRVTTLYLNGKYSTLSIILRFGKRGMKVDNWGSGGIMVGVANDGHLSNVGYDIQLNEYDGYNGIKFGNEVLQQIPSLLDKIENAHVNHFSLCKFIGWDICFNENNEPIVIELNSSQPGIIGEQLCSGPIFGDRTKEVVEYCSNKDFIYNRIIFKY